ncbi:MAG TPA: hypothetical protein VNN78_00905, partial [Burkholderiales bacterium]|nr:hypothetical protein [Burkholderiales bacterium]
MKFKFLGEPFVVHEDWGDSDRYWVGPANPETSKLDITPLHQAFLSYRGTIIWRWIVRLGEMGTDSDGSAPVFQQSGLAFAAAVVACWAYMSAVSGILSAFGPKELSPVLVIVLLVIPFVFCGLFHFTVVRDSDLSMLQKCVQIIGAAFFAPLLGWLV